MKKPIRLGLSGPSGSGKTTLAKWVEETYKIPFIASSASLIISEERRDYLARKYNYKPQGHRNVIRLSQMIPEFGQDFQYALLSSRLELLTEEVKKGNDFVVDRTFLDNAAYTLLQIASQWSGETTQKFVEDCINAIPKIFTHLVLVKPNTGWTENNGSRVDNNIWQNMVVYPTFEQVFSNAVHHHKKSFKYNVLEEWDLAFRKATLSGMLQENY